MDCPKCRGTGEINIEYFGSYRHSNPCDFCKGKEEITWLENIFGVEKWNKKEIKDETY